MEIFESQKKCLTPRNVSQRGVWLLAVLERTKSNSAQYIYSILDFQKIVPKINKWTFDSLEMEIFESHKKCLTPRSVSLRQFWLLAVLGSAKSNSAHY